MKIFDIDISQVDLSEFLDLLIKKAKEQNKFLVGHANIRGLNFAYERKSFREFYELCDLITVDGFGVLLGARFLGQKTQPSARFTCPDYLNQLLKTLSQQDLKIFFLAGEQEMLNKLDLKLKNTIPKLDYQCYHGYFDKSGEESLEILEKVNGYQPNILFVGFGMPHQEDWILRNYSKLGEYVVLPLGACLDFYTNHTYRGPSILTNNGFEWLVRLFTEPRRLWRRYLIGNPLFFYRILLEKMKLSRRN